MALAKDEVIIIKNNDFSESDKIIVTYGRHRGKFPLIAKGVRKIESRNRPAIQTLTRSKITYYEGRNLGVLVEASLISQLELNRDELFDIAKTLVLMNRLIPEDEADEEIYQRYSDLIGKQITLREVNRFRLWLLEHLGYLPDMRRCVHCGQSSELVGVDLVNMVVVCKNCRNDKEKRYTDIDSIRYEGAEMDGAIDRYLLSVIG